MSESKLMQLLLNFLQARSLRRLLRWRCRKFHRLVVHGRVVQMPEVEGVVLLQQPRRRRALPRHALLGPLQIPANATSISSFKVPSFFSGLNGPLQPY